MSNKSVLVEIMRGKNIRGGPSVAKQPPGFSSTRDDSSGIDVADYGCRDSLLFSFPLISGSICLLLLFFIVSFFILFSNLMVLYLLLDFYKCLLNDQNHG